MTESRSRKSFVQRIDLIMWLKEIMIFIRVAGTDSVGFKRSFFAGSDTAELGEICINFLNLFNEVKLITITISLKILK